MLISTRCCFSWLSFPVLKRLPGPGWRRGPWLELPGSGLRLPDPLGDCGPGAAGCRCGLPAIPATITSSWLGRLPGLRSRRRWFPVVPGWGGRFCRWVSGDRFRLSRVRCWLAFRTKRRRLSGGGSDAGFFRPSGIAVRRWFGAGRSGRRVSLRAGAVRAAGGEPGLNPGHQVAQSLKSGGLRHFRSSFRGWGGLPAPGHWAVVYFPPPGRSGKTGVAGAGGGDAGFS